MSTLIQYLVVEEVVTPESAKNGDLYSSDIVDECICSLRDLVESVKREGVEYVESTYNGLRVDHFTGVCFADGSEITRRTFVVASRKLSARIQKLIV